MSFTHLHVHTCYSLLDGASRIEDLVLRAKELSQDALAITDHGVMYGCYEFFKTCIINGVKPIIGCEVYVTNMSHLERSSNEEKYHLILLCENDIGYKNLIKLVSIGFIEGFYSKPRVDYELLNKYHEGLICLTACLAGEIPKALINENYEIAKNKAIRLKEIFGENNFYIEIQNHNLANEIKIHSQLIRLAKELNCKLVATNDSHYTLKEDEEAHDCLLCLQTGAKVSDLNRMKYEGGQYYLKSYDEMKEIFKFCEEALDTTEEIANKCNIHFEVNKTEKNKIDGIIDKKIENGEFDKSFAKFKDMLKVTNYHYPNFVIPENYTNITYLEKLAKDGLKKRFSEITKELEDRLSYELKIITTMGFTDYFLIVWDYINFAKTNNIPVGPGRGSGVGSLVTYVLYITDVNPIKYDLIFERFLNPERISMPDIDTDFCNQGREDVINYVKEKYGENHVSQIVTFGTLSCRAVFKDMGRVLGIPYTKCDSLTKLVPHLHDITIDELLNADLEKFIATDKSKIIEIRNLYNTDDEIKKIIDISKRLEGIPRQNSIHASGVLIASDDVSNFVPLVRTSEGVVTTQYTMGPLEELGLLKMDFLGLRNLTAIKDCLLIIEKEYDKKIDLSKIDYEDEEIFKMIKKGDTLGIFQLESKGMTNFMRKLKPTCIEDLIAGISLYRPGPMDSIPTYIECKNNKDKIVYDTEKLRDILSKTYGCIVYQEQVMQIVVELAGFTLGRADEVRKAMSKKMLYKLEAEKKNFIYGNEELNIKGCIANGISEEVAINIFDKMTDFGKYAFNKSHATAYAILAYQTAYLKRYYQTEFMTSICNSVLFKRDDLATYVNSISTIGIKILPVDINKSKDLFTVEDKNIRMGFASLKGLGLGVANDILNDREKNGIYKSFKDALIRLIEIGVNKKAIENLILCGAFDNFYGNRNQKIHIYPQVYDSIIDKNKKIITGEQSLFSFFEKNESDEINNEEDDKRLMIYIEDIKDFDIIDKLKYEKEISGLYLSGHPLKSFKEFIKAKVKNTAKDFYVDNDTKDLLLEDGDKVTICGIILQVLKKTTKNGDLMANIQIEDLTGIIDIIVFPKKYIEYLNIFNEGNIVYIEGRMQLSDDEKGKVILDKIQIVDNTIKQTKALWIGFKDKEEYYKLSDKINEIITNNKGDDNVVICLIKEKLVRKDEKNKIVINEKIINEIATIIGEKNVRIKE